MFTKFLFTNFVTKYCYEKLFLLKKKLIINNKQKAKKKISNYTHPNIIQRFDQSPYLSILNRK
ncbi:hypothetical protein BpHYR1_039059 [Brachionus plicatilis]|uniref:Uncharacterized protein n=1 Tax=Brachionus plicatilis TaxID=10195 RepID=A0A3M7S3N8_BRAPC|nr:hypothetical protein BpHYR1_039059 [Brachionus plicatilis]